MLNIINIETLFTREREREREGESLLNGKLESAFDFDTFTLEKQGCIVDKEIKFGKIKDRKDKFLFRAILIGMR